MAADKLGNDSGIACITTKIFRIGPKSVVGFSGNSDCCRSVLNWFLTGMEREKWPTHKTDSNRWSVAMHYIDGKLHLYYQEPDPIVCENKTYAIGSGRDFALSAIHLDYNAVDAVKHTIELSLECGMGYDYYDVALDKISYE